MDVKMEEGEGGGGWGCIWDQELLHGVEEVWKLQDKAFNCLLCLVLHPRAIPPSFPRHHLALINSCFFLLLQSFVSSADFNLSMLLWH